jgi:hypothetical protein
MLYVRDGLVEKFADVIVVKVVDHSSPVALAYDQSQVP